MRTRPFAPALLIGLGLPLPALAQDEGAAAAGHVIVAMRIPDNEAIRLDGLLDEAVWSRAVPAGGFIQRDPDNGKPATERTEVRVLFDANRLVLGAAMYDADPSRVLGNQMQRDESFEADDRFMWTLDTFLDGRSGYYFEINPSGAMGDGLIDPSEDGGWTGLGAGINRSWDGIWMARVRRTSAGWTAEIEIPFGTLNFDPDKDTWGANFQRTVRRKNEDSLWTGYLRNQGLARMSNAGRITGLADLSQGLGLDIKPYVVGALASAPGRGGAAAASAAVGVDAFYNVTPALRANLSINTDFAETEVDERRVNLTRFPLFFEEKRDFFLQGNSYFDFASEPGEAVMPFFSRRIGLDERGIPRRIDFGAKLTGQTGPFDLGVLQVRTAAEGAAAPGEDFSVVRLRRRMFRESHVGGLYTRRATRDGSPDAHTVGADFRLRTSTFRGSQIAELSGFFLRTSTPDAAGDSSAFGVRARFPNDPFRASFGFQELQPNYDPAVGFRERVGYRLFNPDAGYYWRPAHPWFREFDFRIDLEVLTDLTGRALTRELSFRVFDVNFHDGSRLATEVSREYERLEEDFEISDGIVLPVGSEYAFTRYEIEGTTAEHRWVAVGGSLEVGGFFSGRRSEYAGSVSLRPRRGVVVTLEAEHNVLDLAEGRFDTDVIRARANTQISPWIAVSNDLQYDSVSRRLGWQMRFRWIERPGNDLFFVYTHNWRRPVEPDTGRLLTLDNRAATKLVYTLRF